MKAIFYVVALLVISGGIYLTLEHSRKFEALQQDRLTTIKTNKDVSANADVKEKELKDERAVLVISEQKREELKQSIDALKSSGATSERDIAELDGTLKAQQLEFAELDKTMKEVGEILKGLGEDITLDNLPDKIQQIEDDKKARTAKLDELTTLGGAAEKLLENNRAELDRLMKRNIERNSRIGRNSMEAVITAVNQDWGFLVIGAGSNSGFSSSSIICSIVLKLFEFFTLTSSSFTFIKK